jgi:hypothetical protein
VRLFANVDKAQEAKVMAVELNRTAYEHANDLIKAGRFVFDKRDAWSEHQPSAQQENDPIAKHGFAEQANGILAITTTNMRVRRGMNFLLAILKTSTGAVCCLRKAGQDTSTMTSKTQQRICTE